MKTKAATAATGTTWVYNQFNPWLQIPDAAKIFKHTEKILEFLTKFGFDGLDLVPKNTENARDFWSKMEKFGLFRYI